MVWWLFEKKGIHHKNHKRIDKLESSLKNSFFNIKKDVFKITGSIAHHGNHISHLKERLTRVENLLIEIQKNFTNQTTQVIEEIEGPESPKLIGGNLKSVSENLTQVQKNIVLRLGVLHSESRNIWIAVKFLAEELYPDKEYSAVRSMVSDYLDILISYGLVKKIRKGRLTYTSLTERGISFFDKTKQKKLLEILNKGGLK